MAKRKRLKVLEPSQMRKVADEIMRVLSRPGKKKIRVKKR